MTKRQREFIKALTATNHSEAPYRTFEHFIEMAYCALAKSLTDPERGDALEARYMRLVGVVGEKRTNEFAEMLGIMTLEISETGRDFLSAIVGSDEVNALSKGAGQFFTPFDVCRMVASMTAGDLKEQLQDRPYITVGEPACGAGGMVLAFAQECRQQGVDLAAQVWFDATDVSALCYQMCFVQMALAGCVGVVRHGNTLSHERWEWALTPVSWRFLGRHGWPTVTMDREEPVEVVDEAEAAVESLGPLMQAGLF